jgi:hypothetical protein
MENNKPKIENDMKNVYSKIKNYLKDKWVWLKTFNKPPQIIIEGDMLVFLTEEDKHAITSLGRIELVINGDIITFSKEKQEWLLKQLKK